ncbi:VOC family protein [Phenylobacterium immobile]|uniref:VOC family protein n=1 Tax=Phenylobacterium immobile TaxID=21 RepID=UPI000A4F6FD1|nr:VOC family protein [Phenylobacterium immobile]
MELSRGRLIDHVHLRTQNLPATAAFYRAVMAALEIPITGEDDEHFSVDELWIDVGEPATHVHLAFQARDEAMVQAFYDAALQAGGRDNGAPGVRDYHPGYYAAFVRDPEGNNIEAVHHGPHRRSAEAVVLTWDA